MEKCDHNSIKLDGVTFICFRDGSLQIDKNYKCTDCDVKLNFYEKSEEIKRVIK